MKIKYILFLILGIYLPIEINAQFLADGDTNKSNLEILEKIKPDILQFDFSTRIEYFSNTKDSLILNKRKNRSFQIDSNIIYIGKFLGSTQIIGVSYSEKDSILLFHNLKNNRWVNEGKFKIEWGNWIDHLDLDGDSINEILLSRGPNMNGNIWSDIYKYDLNKQVFYNAGSICCIDSIDYKNKVVYEFHTGSFWMNSYQTKYKWVNGYLIPIHKVELIPNLKYINSVPRWVLFDYWITYWENIDLTSTQMKRKFKFIYLPKYHSKYWENFKHL